MGLLDKISKSLADYISLADLMGFLSEYQNETIHDIALYLSHYNFDNITNYSITIDNKFHENEFDGILDFKHWKEVRSIINNLIKEFGFFDTIISRGMMREMTFSKIRHYLSKMDFIEISNEQYLAIEKLYRANIHYKKSDLLELDFLSEYLQNNQEFKEWETAYIRPFSDFDNQWYIAQPAITTNTEITTLLTQLDQAHAHIAELERQSKETRSTIKGLDLVNYERQKAREFVCIIAKSIWDMDKTQQIKTGEMVQYVKSLLFEFSPKDVPESDDTLSDWLKEIKPQYATASGRPPKNAPTEIPLTFKK